MKNLTVTILLLATLAALAGPKPKFKPPVTNPSGRKWAAVCPHCHKTNTTDVLNYNGGASVFDTNGVCIGHNEYRSVTFTCTNKNCLWIYGAELPARFVPKVVAVPVTETPPMPQAAPPPKKKALSPKLKEQKPQARALPQPMLWMFVEYLNGDTAVVDWQSFTNSAIVPAEGITNSFNVVCWTGLAWTLGNNGTAPLYVERSTNMINWEAYPGPGAQITIQPNGFVQGILQPDKEFFRAHL